MTHDCFEPLFCTNYISSLLGWINFTATLVRRSIALLAMLGCCSDFRNESNGIFVLGVGFFSSDKFRLFNKPFLTKKFYHSKDIVVLSLNLKRYLVCDYFSQSYGGLKIAVLANLVQLTRDIFLRYQRVSKY